MEGALHRARAHGEPKVEERLGLELQPQEGGAVVGCSQQGELGERIMFLFGRHGMNEKRLCVSVCCVCVFFF